MDQQKTGAFLKRLRNEKNLTQEQLAERFNTTRRSVSRWETGSNLPDIDILIEMSDFYDVDLREILDGERKNEKMDQETKETVVKVAEYSNTQKEKMAKITLVYFIIGVIALIANQAMNFFDLPSTFWVGFAEGATAGLAFVAMIFGILYLTGVMTKIKDFKSRIFQ